MPRDMRTTRLMSRLELIAYGLQRLHFSRFQPLPQAWQPAVNALLREDTYELVVDLAGVKVSSIEIRVSGRQLIIRGRRDTPEPLPDSGTRCLQVLALEIDDGPFIRVLDLPVDIDAELAVNEYRDGFLRVQIPLRDRQVDAL